uniref:Uncharacterized protein n=2 Tax=Meloidogyne incognita TaxID=6306 RepID=A0A914NT19_MELIC
MKCQQRQFSNHQSTSTTVLTSFNTTSNSTISLQSILPKASCGVGSKIVRDLNGIPPETHFQDNQPRSASVPPCLFYKLSGNKSMAFVPSIIPSRRAIICSLSWNATTQKAGAASLIIYTFVLVLGAPSTYMTIGAQPCSMQMNAELNNGNQLRKKNNPESR